jgi:hypothetical protein
MVDKLPVEVDDGWSQKKKIAVGWKITKYLVKKALKMGIVPPPLTSRSSLNCTKY